MSEAGIKKLPESSRAAGSIFNVPNQLTIARLILSIVFFLVIALEGYRVLPTSHTLTLNIAMVVFVLAVSTDFLDGYLARRWGLVSTFGRIADPFVDKIVVCGGFIMLIEVSEYVRPWYAVVLLFREFLVSGLRSFLESRGIPFGATLSGKLKMVLQSTTIPMVLFHEANFAAASTSPLRDIAVLSSISEWLTLALLALTLVTTLASCVGYVRRAATALKQQD